MMKTKRQIQRQIDFLRGEREKYMGWMNPTNQLMRMKIDGAIEFLNWVIE